MRLPRESPWSSQRAKGYQMRQVIETHLPHLTQPQLTGLAWWVCGTILAGSTCQNAVASALSTRGNWNNLRQYLREWLYDGGDRARPCKTELDVSLCFAPLPWWCCATGTWTVRNCGNRYVLRACPRPRPGGWHPYMRYPKNVTFCAEGGRRLPAQSFVPLRIPRGSGAGPPSAEPPQNAVAPCWRSGTWNWYVEQEEPWIILTDLPLEEVGVSWYALRF